MDNRLIKYNKILKKYFGYDSLKPQQFEIIDKLLNEKKDVLGILATGFGKSMTFQLPYLISKKNVIVISPLISLMKDQQSEMEKLGIPTCILNNTNKNKSAEKISILSGMSKIIYITPEYLEYCEDFITELACSDSIAFFCIDEVHCISTYSSFRESYTRLNIIKEWVPDIPILAITATASKKVRSDIIKVLGIQGAYTVIGSFDRPNLYIQVKSKTKDIESDIYHLLKKYKKEYIIVYCKTRDDTDKITDIINKLGIKSSAYHAGLSNKSREEVQNDFIDGKIKCIVATVAFGMGINIKNIRLVVHYGCPKNIESYYQEIGRAGRDGQPSECHMFYSNKDFVQNRYFISEIKNEAYKKYQTEQIQNIERYVYTNDCRRILLLKSFDEHLNIENCNNCDNCKNIKNVIKVDFTIPCYQLLTLSKNFDGKCGGTFLVNVLRGSNAKNISEQVKKNKYYGVGKNKTIQWWKDVIRILINNDYLQEIAFGKFGSTLKCSTKGNTWLNNINTKYKNPEKVMQSDKLLLTVTDEFKKFIKSKIIDNNSDSDSFKITLEPPKKNILINKNNLINQNKKWTKKEESKLLKDIQTKKIKDIAISFNRTDGAIRSRLNYIACKLHESKTDINIISEITKISHDKINKIIIIYQSKKEDKKNNKKK